MANTEKFIDQNQDVVSTKTLLHEAIPLTGTIVSGTYSDNNIKNYSHGMFQSVYDYPYLSSSANHIFDITVGMSSNSSLSASTPGTQQAKKINIYNQMAQVLYGHDETGAIKRFDEDGNLADTTTDKIDECFFLNFSRLLVKDEIKKGSFSLELGVADDFKFDGSTFTKRIRITDVSGSDGFKINSPVGEYGILFAQSTADGAGALDTPMIEVETITSNASVATTRPACGLIFYQAGVAVISGSVFNKNAIGGILKDTGPGTLKLGANFGGASGFNCITGSTIETISDSIRNRIYNLQFNNTTELNSTIYFCRINHNEFNYSANPSYLNASQIRVKTDATDAPISYITSIGLYDNRDRLLAVGKLSEPLRKDPTVEYTLRARLDY